MYPFGAINSDNDLFTDSIKPLPEQLLSYHEYLKDASE